MASTYSATALILLFVGIIVVAAGIWLIYLGIMGILAAIAITAVVEVIVGLILVVIGIWIINRRATLIS